MHFAQPGRARDHRRRNWHSAAVLGALVVVQVALTTAVAGAPAHRQGPRGFHVVPRKSFGPELTHARHEHALFRQSRRQQSEARDFGEADADEADEWPVGSLTALLDALLGRPTWKAAQKIRFEGIGTSLEYGAALSPPSPRDPSQIAAGFLSARTGIPSDRLVVLSTHKSGSSGITHVYLRQTRAGGSVEIANADANVNVDRLGRVISYGESLHRDDVETRASVEQHMLSLANAAATAATAPAAIFRNSLGYISPVEGLLSLVGHLGLPAVSTQQVQLGILDPAVVAAANGSWHRQELQVMHATIARLPFTEADVPVGASWIQTGPGSLALAYNYELEMPSNWYHAHVCARTGQVISVVDWVADATYEVFPLGANDPEDGMKRQVIKHSANAVASPVGWVTEYTTIGNNVHAQENRAGRHIRAFDGKFRPADQQFPMVLNKDKDKDKNKEDPEPYRPIVGTKKSFRFPLDLARGPETYLDASITQLFYTNNILHDVFAAYGFDEAAGNFQTDNFGRGGKGNDAVRAYAQDGSGYNNANFATPPDGRPGKMRMFVWNTVVPFRDGDLENGIVIHEYGHGVSTRLTGGPHNSGCLSWGEAGGMGEGWGDVWATIFRMRTLEMANRTHAPWEMGKYANGGREGIRNYPYSTDMKINPSTYTYLNHRGYWGVHAKGEVWAMILLEVFWNLIDELGFTAKWQSASPKFGNTLFLQLIVDGLKLQPCRPSFLDARDAILQAEQALTNGQHACAVWRGFAKRGLGVDAERIPSQVPWEDETRIDGFSIPTDCQ